MKLSRALVALCTAGIALAGCSSPESAQAEELCSRLDATPVPAVAVAQWSQYDQANPVGSLQRAAAIVRERCPQHAQFAQAVEDVAAVAPKGADGRVLPPDPGAENLRACVEQSGMTEQQCREATARGEGG